MSIVNDIKRKTGKVVDRTVNVGGAGTVAVGMMYLGFGGIATAPIAAPLIGGAAAVVGAKEMIKNQIKEGEKKHDKRRKKSS